MWSPIRIFNRSGYSRSASATRSSESRLHAVRRPLRAERLESRNLMAADPIHVGIVYIETDYLESDGSWGSDEIADRFILSFTGGAAGTQLTEFRISTDKDQDGLSIGDLIFDTAAGGRGKAGWHPFKIRHIDSVTGQTIDVVATVEDGTTELVVKLTNFKAGDLLEFSIDTDEVLRMHGDLDRFNAALDVIASGQEFQDSIFSAIFVAPHYEPTVAEGLFVNDYGDPGKEFGLRIPPDEGAPGDSRPSRSAAAIAHAQQTPKPISIAGTVWADDNLNLKRDNGESVLPGVLVTLLRKDEATGRFVETGHVQVTDANGGYRFGTELGLMPGEYQVVQTQPENYYSVGAVVGLIDGQRVGRAASSDILTGINIPLGDLHAVNYDFAEARPASVSGFVYRDDNDNGRRDPGEQGLGGVVIRLVPRDTLAPISPIETVTAADGSYSFTTLPPGLYDIIEVTQPAGLDDGRDRPGTVDGRTVGVADDPGDAIRGVRLLGNSRGINYDFGELPRGIITGGVYLAPPGEDCGGRDDGRSTPLEGVEVILVGPGGVTIARTTTDAAGQYRFEDVPKGIYNIIEVTPEGLIDGKAHVGLIDGVRVGVAEGGGLIRNIELPAGGVASRYDFCEAAPGRISGYVYHDQNQNGRRDTGEQAIPQTTIELVNLDGKVVATTKTNAQGYYEFNDVLPGNYSIRQVQPVGYLDGLDQAGTIDGVPVGTAVNPGDLITGVNLRQGQTGVNYNFGELRPASLAGRVHLDANGNCTYDPGEQLLSGVTIRLLDSSGREVARTQTDSEGRYKFEGLPPGTYTVVETQPEGYFSGTAKPGSAGGVKESPDRIGNIVLGSGEVAVDYDFCEKPPAEISGYVYVDQNINQQRDPGEAPIAGVRIDLIDSTGKIVATTTTDSSGYYRFSFLPKGEYTLRQTQPAGYLQGSQQAGSGGGNASADDVISEIPIDFGATLTQYNFGELQPASLAGRVHLDANGNCTYDPGEQLLSGVVIRLLDSSGREVARTQTDSEGRYKFEGLPPGTYTVVEIQPEGYFSGTAKPGSAGGVKESPDRIGNITLGSGEVAVDYDFCEKPPAEISGYVYVDQNNNQRRDAGEAPIAGTRVELIDSSGNVVATATTDARGFYRFSFLPAGEYTVRQTQPAGYLQGSQQAGSAGGDATVDDVISQIPIAFGAILTEYNFGELLPGTLSGYVFVDGNGDCVRQEHETGLAGVLIELFDGAGQLVTYTVTDSNGFYLFEGLEPGQYRVVETQPEGYFSGAARPGSGGGRAIGSDIIAEIPVGPGAQLVDYNFCEKLPATIAGHVYLDNNQNGRRDASERPLEGVVIELRDADDRVIATTQTDANGYYQFTGLRPGTYSLHQLQPEGYFQGGQSAGSLGGDDSLEDLISAIVLPGGANAVDYDFAELPPGSISGYVFQDGAPLPLPGAPNPEDLRNHQDGIRSPGDKPLPGVVLQLRDADGRPVSADRALAGIYEGIIQVVTDSDGYYEFIGLPPGVYHIYQVQPDGYIDGLDTPGTTGGWAVNAGDLAANPQLYALWKRLAGDPATDPRYDAILNVTLEAGGESRENNFSEILTEMPIPPVPPAPLPSIEFKPAPVEEPLLDNYKVYAYAEAQYLRRPIVADAEYPVTWHLSIINGGFPRGNGSEGGVKQISSQMLQEVFAPGTKQSGRWTLVDRQGNRVEIGHEILLGDADSVPLVGDFDGDGVDEVAVFAAGQWFVDLNGNGIWDEGDLWLRMGTALDRPVVGDWDGDGKADIAIFGRQWERDPDVIVEDPGLPTPANTRRRDYVRSETYVALEPEQERVLRRGSRGPMRADAIDHVFRYGEQPDTPIAGDWNGDGIDSIAVFRAGLWMLDSDGDGRLTERDDKVQFGQPGDIPIAGDWNGDGITDLGVVRGDLWIIDSDGDRRLTGNDLQIRIPKPSADARPVVGDWDGDGSDEFGWYDAA